MPQSPTLSDLDAKLLNRIQSSIPLSPTPFAALADELGIELHLKNVADEGVYDELATVGGKRQEPFLVDEENDVKMYESDAIIDYFESLTGKKATRHQSTPGVCAI